MHEITAIKLTGEGIDKFYSTLNPLLLNKPQANKPWSRELLKIKRQCRRRRRRHSSSRKPSWAQNSDMTSTCNGFHNSNTSTVRFFMIIS